MTTACAIGIVLLVIVIVLNLASKMITKKLMSKKESKTMEGRQCPNLL